AVRQFLDTCEWAAHVRVEAIERTVITEALGIDKGRAILVETDLGGGRHRTGRSLREKSIDGCLGGQAATLRKIRARGHEAAAVVERVGPAIAIELTVFAEYRLTLGPVEANHDVAAVIAGIHAEQHTHAIFRAVAFKGFPR